MHSQENIDVLVLDTNVVLDWLVFRNPGCAPLAAALQARRVRWVATAAMLDELAHVLKRGLGARWSVDDAAWRDAWQRHAEPVPVPEPARTLPRCSDPDDQKFLDLALTAPARWLLTRDRALLKLARRARAYGVEVLTPERWAGIRTSVDGR